MLRACMPGFHARVPDREMEGLGDGAPVVVIVDLDRVLGLRLRKAVEREVHDIPSHRPLELFERGELPVCVCEGAVFHWYVAEEDSQRAERHLVRPQVEPRVQVRAVHEGRRVEGYVRVPLGSGAVL